MLCLLQLIWRMDVSWIWGHGRFGVCVPGGQRRLQLCGAHTHPADPRDPPAHGRLYARGLAGTSHLSVLKKSSDFDNHDRIRKPESEIETLFSCCTTSSDGSRKTDLTGILDSVQWLCLRRDQYFNVFINKSNHPPGNHLSQFARTFTESLFEDLMWL